MTVDADRMKIKYILASRKIGDERLLIFKRGPMFNCPQTNPYILSKRLDILYS